ncbi:MULTISPECIES: chemotaxis protein CheB [unclassified Pseudomonas]|uniref:chemotaxis protein CheB n=1 Tax=unclassified Pseudomonas TaxID=196821 RepID=UPI00257ECCD9|nr:MULTISPECIES: chemotaxis protein CheB [unclassified Pseudomonas]
MKLDADTRNIVVIGASAGGVQALTKLFQSLPPGLPAAFLVVLHIPAYAPSVLPEVLSRVTQMRVVPADDSQPLEAGSVYVATSDRHLTLEEEGLRVTRGPKECRVRPAIDVLFRSAAVSHGARVIGVILTGALDDGTAGLWAIKDREGLALVQDPSEAMHESMSESAIKHVKVDFIGPIEALAQQIVRAVGTQIDRQHARPAREGHVIEKLIELKGNGLEAGVMSLGAVSKYTCPECHGFLVQIEEGSIIRFRCHTGHAFSMKTLIAEVNEAIDNGLWDTLRAVEERVVLLRQMAELADRAGSYDEAAQCRYQADESEKRLQPLRELVLDSGFFGHDQMG